MAASLGSFLGGVFGNNLLQTIFTWQVAAQILGAGLNPFVTQLQQAANAAHPELVLSPADAADMRLRGWIDQATQYRESEGSGVNNDRAQLLYENSGEPPGPTQVMEMLRRGIIPETAPQGEPSFDYGIKTSRIRDEWIPAMKALRYGVPTPGDVIDALVENQVDRATAEKLLSDAGMDPSYLDLLYHTRGRPPGPGQLADMVHRGIIPEKGTGPTVTSFEQGVSESAVKDKWTDPLYQLSFYIPPPRTLTAMLREGALTTDQAREYFGKYGLDPTLAGIYVAAASSQKVAAHKNLAESTVVKLYTDEAIDGAQATEMLGLLGYDPHEATFILSVADMARYERFLSSAISRVRTLYDSRKITGDVASTSLDHLGVAPAQRDQLLGLWQMERAANVRLLTEAQVVDAWYESVIDQATAERMLQALGYSAYDAWVLLGIKNKGPLPNPPGVDAAFPSGNIT